jgi:autotransporter-associated beta strand protein
MNVFNEESGLTWNIQGTVHSGTTYTATLELTNDNGPLLSNQTANIRSNGNLVVYSNYNPNRLLSNGINFYDGSTLRMIVNNADNGLIDMDAASVTYTVKAAQPGAATNATIAVQGWWEGNWNAGARINRLVLENGSKLTVDTQGNKMLEVRQVVVNAGNTGEIRRTQSNNDPNPANNWWFQYANYPYCGHTLLIDQLNVAPGATIAFGPATDLTRVEQIGNSANDPLLGSLKITGTIDDSNLLLLPAQPAITINQNLEVADGGRYSPTLNGSGPISATKTFNIGGDVKTTGSGTLNVAPTTSFNVTGQLLNNGAVSSTGAIGVGPGGNMNVATISNSTGWWKPNAGSVMTLTAGPTPSTFKVGGAGKVVVPAATAMPVNSDVTVGDSGTLDLATATRQISTLTMTGGTLANGTAQVANSISLQSGTVKASLTGNAPMVKSGPGTATLQGVNTNFGGTVSITEGTLLLKSALGHPLAGAALWLDANNPATMHVVGGLVTQWDDAAGGAGNVAQGDPNRQPTYVQDAIGGLPAVHFSAAGTADLLYNVIDYPSSPNGVTIFSVSRLTGGSNLRLITATNNNWLLGYWGGGIDRAWFNDGWVSLPNTPADRAPHMYEAVIRGPGGNSDLYVYDARNPGVVQLASNQASVNGPNGLALGGWGTGAGEPSDGDVGEILIYNRVLTAEERAQVESYLKGKWWESGIGNAPVDNLPDMTPVNISAGATLQAATAETIGPLNGPAGAQVTLNRGSALLVNANAAAPTNFAGTANIGPNATLTINLSAQNTYAPTINLQAVDSTFAAVANSPSSFGGTFSGPGTFTKDGPSSLAIQDQPGFTGMVQIKAGALQVSSNVSLSNAILKVAAGDTGHLEVQGGATTLTFGGLTGNGAFAMPSGVTVRVGNNNQDTTFSGSLSGAATLQKIGNGTLTLAGPAAHTGAGAQDPTVVTSGTLNLTDGAHLTGNIDVQGGTLKITSFLLPANAAGVYTFDSVNGNAVSNEGTLGASYNATFQNSATTTPNGHKGPGLWLDNQNNAWLAVDLQPNGRGIDLSSGKWTASAWFNGIYTSGQGADWRTLFRGNSSDHQIIIQDGTWNLGCYANGNGEFRITDTAYQMNQVANSGWHQITAVGSGSNIKMYVDGLYVGQTDRNSIADIYAIGNGMGWTQKFAKAIDDVYIYQRDLNADEVYNLYGATSASGVGDAISDTAQVKLSAAGTLDVSGGETIGRLEGVAGSQVVLHDYSRLAVNPAALNTFPGTITGPETSTFAKTGAATFVLPGTYATFLGRTEVDAGTLQFTQSNNGPGTLVVKGGGTATAPGISTGRAVLLDGTAVNAAVLTLTNPGEASHVSSLGLPGSVANSLATLNLGGDGSSLLADSLSLANSARLTVNGPGVLTVAGGTLEAGTQVNLSTRMVASGVAGPGTIAVSDGGLLAGAPGMALITAPVQLNAGGAIDAGDGTAGAVVLLDALNIATAGRIHLGIGAGTNGAVNVASTLNFTGTPVVVVPNTVTAPSAYTFLTGAVPAAGPDWGLGVAGGSPNISWNNGDGAWDGTGPNYHWSGADTVQGYVDGYGTGALTVHITGAGALGPVATSNVLIGPLMTAANKTVIGPSAAAAVAQLTIGSNPHTGAALSVGAGDLTVSGVTTIASDGALLTGTSGPGGFSTGSLALAGQMTVGAATTATVVGTASATGTANLSVLGTLNADRLDANVTPGTGAVNFQAGAQGTIATLNVLAGSTTLAGSQAINTANFSGGVALMTSGSIGSGASGGANVNPGGDFRPSGGAINKLNVAGGTASVSGAAAVDKANVAGGTANVSGGSITTVDVTGGNATVTGGSIATANLNGGTLNVNNAAPIATLNVAGGTMNLSGVGATANTVVLTGGRIDTGTAALTVTNRMVLPDAYTATISRTSPADPPPSFTMAGSNLVDNAGTRTVTLSGGTLALTAVGGKIAYDPAWGVTVSDEFYSPGIRALDGSGLAPPNPTSDPQTHDAAYTNMWTMNENHRAGWLAIDFGLPTTVSKLHVWNYNQNWEVANGITARSAKNVELQTSLNGTDWTTFQTSVFPAAPGADGYAGFDLPLTSSQTTRYFRFNILDNQGGTLTGLSEVQFYKAGHPVDLPQTHVAVQAGAVTTLDLGDPANDHRLGNLVLSDDCFLTIAGAKSVAFQVVSNASNDEGVSAVEYSNPQGFSIPIVVQQVLRPQGVLNVNTDLVLDVGAAASLVLKAGAAEVYQHVNLMGNALTLGNGVLPAGDLLVSFGSTPPDGWAGTYDLFTGIYPGYLSGTFANDTTPPAAPTGYEWNVWPDGKWIKYDALGSDSNLAVKVQLNLMGIVGIESYWTHGSPVNNHWGNGDNWANGGVPRVPSQAGDTARFDTTAGSPSGGIVVIDGGGKSAAKLFFHSAGSYAITGSPLTLDNGFAPAEIHVSLGSHSIGAELRLASALTLLPAAGATLTLGDVSETSPGKTITLNDAGKVVLTGVSTYTGLTTVSRGELDITVASAWHAGNDLVIGAHGQVALAENLILAGSAATAVHVAPVSVSAVPEPGAWALLGAAATAALGMWWRRKARK